VRTQSQSRVGPLIVFLDRSLGKHIVAEALRQAGAAVEVHDDHFLQDARDEEWLREVGQRTVSAIASMNEPPSSKQACEPLCLPEGACLAQRWLMRLFKRCRLCGGLWKGIRHRLLPA
jgi:hypothetical protein